MQNNAFLTCAYYTHSTPYEGVYHEYLEPSLKKLKMDYHVEAVPPLGSWQKNTSYKACFAQQVLQKFPDKNILLVDVDAEITQYPKLFEEIPENFNIAAHILDHASWYKNGGSRKEFLSGSLFLRNTGITHYLVEIWRQRCLSTPLWEQQVFENVLKEYSIEVYNLPITYCYINTLPNGQQPYMTVTNPIIIHHQKSREYRHNV